MRTLTPDLSKLARRQLAVSQRDVIEATGLASYKLKQFEANGLNLKVADLRALRDFYAQAAEEKGLSFDEIEAQYQGARPAAAQGSEPEQGAPRPGFLFAGNLAPALEDQLLTAIDASDDRIAEIVKTGIKSGVFSDISEETETLVRELFGHLAANYLRVRGLQGRNIVAPMRDEAQTVGDYLAQWLEANGVGLTPEAAHADLADVE